MSQPHESEGTSQAEPLSGRIDTDDIDFADRLVPVSALPAGSVHLGPVKPDEGTFAFRQEEPFRVEPLLALAQAQVVQRRGALLGVLREAPRVHLHPRPLVPARREGTDPYIRRQLGLRQRRGQRQAHLPQRANSLEAHRRREPSRVRMVAVRPQPHGAAVDGVQQRLDQGVSVPAPAMGRGDGELRARPLDRVGRVEMSVTGQLSDGLTGGRCCAGLVAVLTCGVVAGVQQKVACPFLAAVPQVQHHMLVERPHAVLLGDGFDQPRDLGRLALRQLPCHDHAPVAHVPEPYAPGSPSQPAWPAVWAGDADRLPPVGVSGGTKR